MISCLSFILFGKEWLGKPYGYWISLKLSHWGKERIHLVIYLGRVNTCHFVFLLPSLPFIIFCKEWLGKTYGYRVGIKLTHWGKERVDLLVLLGKGSTHMPFVVITCLSFISFGMKG